VKPNRKQALGMRWLIGYARKRNEKTMTDKLAAEIIAASKGEGAAVKKKRRHLSYGRSQQSILPFPILIPTDSNP